MEPVAPRLMGQEAVREQEVTQHSECEEVAPHGFTPYYSTIILTRMVQTSTVWFA